MTGQSRGGGRALRERVYSPHGDGRAPAWWASVRRAAAGFRRGCRDGGPGPRDRESVPVSPRDLPANALARSWLDVDRRDSCRRRHRAGRRRRRRARAARGLGTTCLGSRAARPDGRVRSRGRAVAGDAGVPRRGLRPRRPRDQRRQVRVVRVPPAGDAAARPREPRRGAAAPRRGRLERRCDVLGTSPVPRNRLGVRGQAARPEGAVVRRDPRFRRPLRGGVGRRCARNRPARRSSGGTRLGLRRPRGGRARRDPLRRDDRGPRAVACRGRRTAGRPCPARAERPARARARRGRARRHGRYGDDAGRHDRALRGVHRPAREDRRHGCRELCTPDAARVHRRADLARPPDHRRRLAGLERGVGVRAVPRRRPRPLPRRARPGVPLARAPVGNSDALPPGRSRPRDRGDRRAPRARGGGDRDGHPRDPLLAGRALWSRLAARRRRRVDGHRSRRRPAPGCADVAFIRVGGRP